MTIFGERLKELRKTKGTTQKQVADAIGIAERNYQRYEAVPVNLPAKTIVKLADYFNVTTDYLLGRFD